MKTTFINKQQLSQIIGGRVSAARLPPGSRVVGKTARGIIYITPSGKKVIVTRPMR